MEKNKFPDKFTSGQFSAEVHSNEIESLCERLADQINELYRGESLVLVGVLKGCLPFMSDLIRKIYDVEISIDFVKIGNRGRTKENEGTIILEKDLSTDIFNRNVMIIEEIIDTGRATLFLKNRIQLSRPKSLKMMTLFDKRTKRKVELTPDFIGKELGDLFVIGYGLDLNEYGRNFNSVYSLEYPN